jgi:hypothetical protein
MAARAPVDDGDVHARKASAADPRHAPPESAYQRAAAALRDHASNAQRVPTLPATLAHVHDTLDLPAVSIQRMAQAVADWCGADGRNVDEDVAPPTALEGSRERSGPRPPWSWDVARPRRADVGTDVETVVVGYDGSPPAERALKRAATLVATHGRVVVVMATPSLGPPGLVSEPHPRRATK